MKILYVEDIEINFKVMQAMTSALGLQTLDHAENGHSALNMCQDIEYDLIFMDINLPDISGLKVTEHIKCSTLNKNTPIIAVSADVTATTREAAIEVGCDDYLTKPVNMTILKDTLDKIIDPQFATQP
ncbi:response regulator [Kordiimonas sp. SCSIO 12610]|uniref:response regulator n=1 Tax=Kordiimonas sp. SCSIO 12610 TaxID=2829597 RepID=UPI00210AE17F|nr:response regulator [Kordiimonas sp. SCSIO 12610]UTW55420.1 response regulator [Kordiimonas sp. SCSIO 12610]